jgi:hypothetical protein
MSHNFASYFSISKICSPPTFDNVTINGPWAILWQNTGYSKNFKALALTAYEQLISLLYMEMLIYSLKEVKPQCKRTECKGKMPYYIN